MIGWSSKDLNPLIADLLLTSLNGETLSPHIFTNTFSLAWTFHQTLSSSLLPVLYHHQQSFVGHWMISLYCSFPLNDYMNTIAYPKLQVMGNNELCYMVLAVFQLTQSSRQLHANGCMVLQLCERGLMSQSFFFNYYFALWFKLFLVFHWKFNRPLVWKNCHTVELVLSWTESFTSLLSCSLQ